MIPKIAILKTDGINCDAELFHAFKIAGGSPENIHINQLVDKSKNLKSFQILAIPGGFSYGDDILSGKILANELRHRLKAEMENFISQDKLVIGVCNGFQTLVRTGFLPWKMKPAEDASLILNASGHFECRWIKVKVSESSCVFTKGLTNQIFELPVAHGEGKLIVKDPAVGQRLIKSKQIVLQYVDDTGNVTKNYPQNPNGSFLATAGITDQTGRIFGLMPHPERNVLLHQHPDWRTKKIKNCRIFFENAVNYFK